MRVLEAYARQHLHLGPDDGGGIEPPAQTRFHHRHVATPSPKVFEGECRQELKLSDAVVRWPGFVDGLGHRAKSANQFRKLLLRARNTVDQLAFRVRHEVGRYVRADTQAVFVQDG
ncbi:MAG: hypothetical protein BWY79_00880 [Actinobacteria bacterium ADurb.Bin444]|nr:MAG: hypothetical protein BWY79_00880 [Actinobacteria bacterium ADurb.Bin444]